MRLENLLNDTLAKQGGFLRFKEVNLFLLELGVNFSINAKRTFASITCILAWVIVFASESIIVRYSIVQFQA